MPRSILLRLEAPLQSWGTQGRFSIRDTDTEPSKSGVIGLVGAALGMHRNDRAMLAELAGMEMAVRVDREGSVLRDYHTAGGGTFRGRLHGVWMPKDKGEGDALGNTVLSDRFYLADASFLVALSGDDDALLERIEAALLAPVWPLFLGRKACPPARPVLAGVVAGAPRDVLEAQPYPGRLVSRGEPPAQLRMSVEETTGTPRYDVPISFERYARTHSRRFITTKWINTPPVEDDAP